MDSKEIAEQLQESKEILQAIEEIPTDKFLTCKEYNTILLRLVSDADDVIIQAEDDVVIRDNDGSTSMAKFINGGSVELYEAGTKRLETTTTGVSVAGTTISNGGDFITCIS